MSCKRAELRPESSLNSRNWSRLSLSSDPPTCMEPVMGECTEPSASTNRENREPERFRERGRGRERGRRGQAKAGSVRLRLQLRLSEKRWNWWGEWEYNGRFKYEPFKCCWAVRNIRQQHYAQKRKQPVKLNIYLSRCHFYIPMPLLLNVPARI